MRILFIILFLAFPLAAQTRAEIESRYGPGEGNRYRVKSGIAVEVDYADSGKVKQFRIVPDDPNDKNALMPIDEVRRVIRELVPGRICRPRSTKEIEVPCPPRKSCRGVEEVFRTLTALMVSYNNSAAYALLTLSDELIPAPGNMTLLAGYEHQPQCGIDTAVGVIKKAGGIEINYDNGRLAGNFASRYANSSIAEWTRTEQIDGDSVVIVLTKEKRIIATFENANANFFARVGSQSEIDDFLKMVLTYHPSK
jgi:hypothetical protein